MTESIEDKEDLIRRTHICLYALSDVIKNGYYAPSIEKRYEYLIAKVAIVEKPMANAFNKRFNELKSKGKDLPIAPEFLTGEFNEENYPK